ncbi:MAG: hypothetical protein ABUT39_12705 [Acidobacteriota bacterium]
MAGKNRSIDEVLASLEAQAGFHREREAFHAAEATAHLEKQRAHAAELAEISRRLEGFRSAAGEALELSDRSVPAVSPDPEEEDTGPASRPDIRRMAELLLKTKGPGERFGPVTLTREINARFADRLRRPVTAAYVSVLLRRLGERGLVRLVRRGRPHWEALYVREEEKTP